MRLTTTELREREGAARELYGSPCRLCARFCEVDRRAGGIGACFIDDAVHLAGWGIHFGEEPELTGPRGCGLVLFGACNLACQGCETASFSRERKGVRRSSEAELAGVVLELARRGAETVQFVTPTHQMPAIVSALRRARDRGFDRPVVWNCGGYESVEALRLLDGVVDIYLPDLKHGDDAGGRLTGVSDYATVAADCLAEMHRQVGDLVLDERGIATKGVLVRHLVLPDGAAGTEAAMRTIAGISRQMRVNVMYQYQPVHQLAGHVRLGRRTTPREVEEALAIARAAGLERAYSPGFVA